MTTVSKAPISNVGFIGHEYRVYDDGVCIGRVRVEYADDKGQGSGRERWISKFPWQFTMNTRGQDDWTGGYRSRNEAAGALAREKREGKKNGNEKKETPKVEPKKAPIPAGYPKEKFCPNGHGSHTFNGPTEELLVSKCVKCDAALVNDKPDDTRSEFKDLPDLPETRHERLPMLVSALQAGRHVYLAGPPGTGKSELGRQASTVLGWAFHTLQCDSSMTRSSLLGFIDANGTYHRTGLREAFEFGGVFLLDEIDNGNPSLLAALNSAMANGFMSFPDGEIEAHADFRVVATANTWGTGPTAEFVGRLRIDPATLDRFVRLMVGIDPKLEEALVKEAASDEQVAAATLKAVRAIRVRVENEGIKIVISPRASMQTAALMARGWSMRDALMTTALNTLDDKRAADIMGGVR